MTTIACDPDPEPDQSGPIIYVGQDRSGHWLVQDSGRQLEGRFVSRGAAMSFAHAESETYHASLQLATMPMIPLIAIEQRSIAGRGAH